MRHHVGEGGDLDAGSCAALRVATKAAETHASSGLKLARVTPPSMELGDDAQRLGARFEEARGSRSGSGWRPGLQGARPSRRCA